MYAASEGDLTSLIIVVRISDGHEYFIPKLWKRKMHVTCGEVSCKVAARNDWGG
jgi:hypothetical protein